VAEDEAARDCRSMTALATRTPKQDRFLEALISEEVKGDARAAMRIAGYSDKTKVVDVARELRTEIREVTETLLALYAPQAAFALISILDDPNNLSARHIISASKEILDRTGFGVKTQMEVEISNQTAMFILPPKAG
jgi:hypothetical protein